MDPRDESAEESDSAIVQARKYIAECGQVVSYYQTILLDYAAVNFETAPKLVFHGKENWSNYPCFQNFHPYVKTKTMLVPDRFI